MAILPQERLSAPEPASGEPAVVFEEVQLAFGDNVVLDGVSFRLHRGETKALFGVAGSGKSIILKLVLGLLAPDSGRIIVLGRTPESCDNPRYATAQRALEGFTRSLGKEVKKAMAH